MLLVLRNNLEGSAARTGTLAATEPGGDTFYAVAPSGMLSAPTVFNITATSANPRVTVTI